MSRGRVLVVEDEWLIATQLDEALVEAGFETVGPFARIDPALQAIEADPPDFALLDINLGGAQSYPVARELANRGIGFIFLSGYVHRDLPDEFQNAMLLSKPVKAARLREAIDALVPINSARPAGAKR